MELSIPSASSLLGGVTLPILSFLFNREKNYLSVDIGSSSVKMLEVRGGGRKIQVLHAGIALLPTNAVQGNVIQDPGAVARVIQTLKEERGMKATEVLTAVPGPAVIIKRATFPSQENRQLRETILFEAGNFIPESLENVNLDYQVLGPGQESNSVEVLLVAVRKDVINSYVTAVEEAGLIPVVVDVDYFAVENMFETNYAPGADDLIALVNIGARYSSINIMKHGQSVFTGDVPVGGRQFTDALMREFHLSYDQAEEVKRKGETQGVEPAEVERVLAATSEQFLDEMQRALNFFWTDSAEEQLTKVYISGGAASLASVGPAMSERLQVPVEVADPFRALSIGRHIDRQFLRQNASALAVSVGLGTRKPGDK